MFSLRQIQNHRKTPALQGRNCFKLGKCAMRVILLQDIYKHGVAGEIVDVADGFARNYLLPRGMAEKASGGALKMHGHLMEQVEARRAQYENKVNEVARQIDGVELFFERRAASTGKLFGSVTTIDIAEELERQTGVDINRRRISQQSLRELGTHEVSVRLGTEISPDLKITIVREGELQEFLQKRAAGELDEDTDDTTEATEAVETTAIAEDTVDDTPTDTLPETMAQDVVAAAEGATDTPEAADADEEEPAN